MEAAGIRTRLLQTDGQPAIYGETAGPQGAPTIPFYGPYSVQSPEPLEHLPSSQRYEADEYTDGAWRIMRVSACATNWRYVSGGRRSASYHSR